MRVFNDNGESAGLIHILHQFHLIFAAWECVGGEGCHAFALTVDEDDCAAFRFGVYFQPSECWCEVDIILQLFCLARVNLHLIGVIEFVRHFEVVRLVNGEVHLAVSAELPIYIYQCIFWCHIDNDIVAVQRDGFGGSGIIFVSHKHHLVCLPPL